MAEATTTPAPSEPTTPSQTVTEPTLPPAEASVAPAITPPSTEASPLGGEGATNQPGAESESGPASEAAPIEYDLKFPEGVTPAEDALTAFKTFAQERGLKNEDAQQLVDMFVSQTTAGQTSLRESIAAEQTAAWTSMIDGWKADLRAMPAFDSPEKLSAAQVAMGSALDEYGSPEARQAFDLTGAGWNPHIISFIHRMASALQEGKPLVPSPQPPRTGPKTPGQALYGDTETQG